MERYLFCISFNGSSYFGWQVQKNCVTVQSVVQDAIEAVLGSRFNVKACSRTDSGVHANNFYFHMDLNLKISLNRLIFALNNKFPQDVVLKSVKKVEKNFHARYSVKKKEYIYKIWTGKFKNPFLKGLVLNYFRKIDLKRILKAAKFLVGKHNFSSFCGSGSSVLEKTRTIYLLDAYFEGEMLIFKIVGDGFLYNMVRIIVGTLLEVSEGALKPEDVKKILEKKDRKFAGRTVKAAGLYLNEVTY